MRGLGTPPVGIASPPEPRAETAGIAAFLLLMVGSTWLPAALVSPLISISGGATRLLEASLVYAGLVTVQPLLAVAAARRWFDGAPLDLGWRRVPGRWQWLAVIGPLALIGAASGAALLLDGVERAAAAELRPVLAPGLAGRPDGAYLVLGFVAMIAALWVQALTEEVGWRGYLLPRLMRALGPIAGLFAHGVLWGLWYAPLLLVASGTGFSSVARCAAFVVTCSLLGVLLGWIRIGARSLVASATSNALLTMAAALPLALQGGGPLRTAIYLPVGWIPLALAVVVVLTGRQRHAIRAFARR